MASAAVHDADAAPAQFVDITAGQDGGILKRVVKVGAAAAGYPVEGCPVKVQFVGRTADDRVFASTRDVVDGKHVGGTDDPVVVALHRTDEPAKAADGDTVAVPLAFHTAIAGMHRGEVAQLIVRPPYGFPAGPKTLVYGADPSTTAAAAATGAGSDSGGAPSKEGLADTSDVSEYPGLKRNETMFYELEVVEWSDPLPRMPTAGELAESRRRDAEEEARRAAELGPEPTHDERIAAAAVEKDKGNAAMAERDYAAAQKYYDAAFVSIFVHPKVWDYSLPPDAKAKYNMMRAPLHLNRGLAKIRQGAFDDAEWDCQKAVELDPTNPKALYRRGLVWLGKLNKMLAKEDAGEFWDPERGMPLAAKARLDLEAAKAVCEGGTAESAGAGGSSSGSGGDDGGGSREGAAVSEHASKLPAIEKALRELTRADVKLARATRKYERERDKLFQQRMMGALKKRNDAEAAADAAAKAEAEAKERTAAEREAETGDMPDLG